MANPFKNPLLLYPLIGAGLGGGAGYLSRKLTQSEASLRADSYYMKRIRRAAVKAGIQPDSPEFKEFENKIIQKELKEGPKKSAISGAISGGLTGGLLGFSESTLGQNSGNWSDYEEQANRYYQQQKGYDNNWHRAGGYGAGGSLDDLKKALNLSGNEKTKKEVQRAFHRLAQQHHPDKGGSEEAMAKANDAWDKIKETSWFQKLAFDQAFWLGFTKKAYLYAG